MGYCLGNLRARKVGKKEGKKEERKKEKGAYGEISYYTWSQRVKTSIRPHTHGLEMTVFGGA